MICLICIYVCRKYLYTYEKLLLRKFKCILRISSLGNMWHWGVKNVGIMSISMYFYAYSTTCSINRMYMMLGNINKEKLIENYMTLGKCFKGYYFQA